MQASDLERERARLMRLAAFASVSVAVVLIAWKLWAWYASGSIAVLSSLADSTLDLVASLITLVAVRVALTPADREHRFGHGKSEGVAGLVQALIVTASALFVAVEAVGRLLRPEPPAAPAAALTSIAASLLLTLGLFAFQRRVIARTGSLAISADSMHYRADILTNAAILVGLFVAYRFSWYVIDPLLGLLVVGVILWSVRTIVVDALAVLLDRELPAASRREIERIAHAHPAVLGVHDIRTRSSGSTEFIQMHLELDPALTLLEAHAISEEIEAGVQEVFPGAEVLIHVDPHGVSEPRDPF
ncbi:MAG TPA: cation diffusion facilitator family transporter [Gammaproteobacteria bacterium]